jgi:hypothetical protein
MLLAAPNVLKADVAPLQASGGSVSAKTIHKAIRMDSEEVKIHLEKGSYTVEAVFHFYNTGDTTTEWVGFPKGDQSYEPLPDNPPDFIQFHAWVDGNRATFSDKDKLWLAQRVKFPGNAKTIIRIMYEANYYRGSIATYVIGTGAAWKDDIGKALFIVDGSEIGGTENFSAGLRHSKARPMLSAKAIRLLLKDFEPKPKEALRIELNSQRRR